MSLKSETWRAIAVGAFLLIISASAIAASESFGALFVSGALVPYGAAVLIIVTRIEISHPYPTFGAANVVTVLRLVLVCLFAGLALHAITAATLSPMLAWLFCLLAILERSLDGVDGYLARKQGVESAFGARFDMEVDALQILLLSIVAFLLDKAGPWVLIGGLLRYAFLGAGVLWRTLGEPLPPSLRRKAIAVVQGVTLAALLAPIVMPPFSALAAAMALVLLIYSFTVDILWVLRSRSKV